MDHVTHLVTRFPAAPRPDLWSGVGLACAYAGGTDRVGAAALRAASGGNAGHLAQSAAFAAKARVHAGFLLMGFADVVAAACGHDPHTAAAITDRALTGLPTYGSAAVYLRWRLAAEGLLTGRGVPA